MRWVLISPLLQLRKSGYRVIMYLAPDHTDSERQIQNSLSRFQPTVTSHYKSWISTNQGFQESFMSWNLSLKLLLGAWCVCHWFSHVCWALIFTINPIFSLLSEIRFILPALGSCPILWESHLSSHACYWLLPQQIGLWSA